MNIEEDSARFAEYVHSLDIIQPMSYWPLVWKNIAFNPYKGNRDRFGLFVFLWANGVPPEMAGDIVFWWIRKGYQQKKNQAHYVNHYRQLIRQARGDLGYNAWLQMANTPVYDLDTRTVDRHPYPNSKERWDWLKNNYY